VIILCRYFNAFMQTFQCSKLSKRLIFAKVNGKSLVALFIDHSVLLRRLPSYKLLWYLIDFISFRSVLWHCWLGGTKACKNLIPAVHKKVLCLETIETWPEMISRKIGQFDKNKTVLLLFLYSLLIFCTVIVFITGNVFLLEMLNCRLWYNGWFSL